MARHAASLVAALTTLAIGGCFEWAPPTQPPGLGKDTSEIANQPKRQSMLDAIDLPPEVPEVVAALHDHPNGTPVADQAPLTSSGRSGGGGGSSSFGSDGSSSSGGGDGAAANSPRHTGPLFVGDITITDVVEVGSGASIMGENAPAALKGDMTGMSWTLKITGQGFSHPKPHIPNLFGRYAIDIAAGFLTQTFVGNNPIHRALLDDTIPLQPTSGGNFNDTELTVKLDTRQVVDLMLAGMHTLSVTAGPQRYARVPVRFEKPDSAHSLAPKVASAKLVNTSVPEDEWLIEVKGRGFPVDFRKSYAKLNDQRAYWHATYVGATECVGYVHVPEGALQGPGKNTLTVITPFGIAMASL